MCCYHNAIDFSEALGDGVSEIDFDKATRLGSCSGHKEHW